MTTYSPETQALLADIIAGHVCPDCGASERLQHFDDCAINTCAEALKTAVAR